MKQKPTVISLFAGCGGSSLGYKWAGYKELLAIDFDENAVETFKLNFDIPIWCRDIKEVTGKEILEFCKIKKGELDLLDGSPPCQGFSTAGKRQVTDSRNQLFLEYVRLINELQPKVFVMENVSGMIKGRMRGMFKEIILTLKSTGYNVKCALLNAMYYEVPQSRERLIWIGCKSTNICFPKPSSKKIITFSEATKDLSETKQNEDIQHIWVDEIKKNTKWIKRASKLKQGEKLIPTVASGKRIYLNRVCPTLQKNSMPNCPPYVRNSLIHPTESRTLSIREQARCHSFPDSFMFSDALKNGMQRIGNSVPPKFMYHIAKHIKETL